jgi:hypothetical protein
MSKSIVVVAFLCTGLVTACGGGGSGVSGDKTLVSLSEGETTDLCEYFVDLAGSEREVDCGGGLTVTVGGGSVSECVVALQASRALFPGCTATVSNAESCMEDLTDFTDAQLCSDGPLPAACLSVFNAQCGGGGL